MRMIKRAATGFASGSLATIPMTGEFWFAWRVGFLDEVPPHKAIRSVAPEVQEPRLSWVSALAHLAVGGVAGAAYAVLVPERARGIASGMVFGLGLWATGYEVVMPAATDIEPAHRDNRSRAATIFIAHLIFGAVLGLSVERAGRRHSR
jgi:uncharacterized membrane protein YagU involved in acid resistance